MGAGLLYSVAMTVVDMHSHAFPDELAPRAIEALEAKADWKAFGSGTIDARLRSMDDAGIDMAVLTAEWIEYVRNLKLEKVAGESPRPAK